MEAKQAELAQLKQIEGMSAELVAQLEAISSNFDTLANGTEGAGRCTRRRRRAFHARCAALQLWRTCWGAGASC